MALTAEEETKIKALLLKYDRIGAFLTIDDLKKQRKNVLQDFEDAYNPLVQQMNSLIAQKDIDLKLIDEQITALDTPN